MVECKTIRNYLWTLCILILSSGMLLSYRSGNPDIKYSYVMNTCTNFFPLYKKNEMR